MFSDFQAAVQKQFASMKDLPLFRVDIDKDKLWETYLSSFPEGSNPIYRERTEHDCSCCRQFVKSAGGMVAVKDDGEVVSLWDCRVGGAYQVVADALSAMVKAAPIANVFLHAENAVGTAKNFEQIEGDVKTWEHFHIQLPKDIVVRGDAQGAKLGDYRSTHDVYLRGLSEITMDSIDTVLDLIAQGSLYRGEEKKALVETFRRHKEKFDALEGERARDVFAWAGVLGNEAFACRTRSDVIGTLLVDLSEGVDLERAVAAYESKTAPANYKRPTALITPAMREKAKKALQDLGLMTALERRFATIDDVSVNDLLFTDAGAKQPVNQDVFDELPVKANTKQYDKVEEVPIEKFIADILPKAKSIAVKMENRHAGNLVSLIAPVDATAAALFKWDNLYSWSYAGDMADSIKERVKKAGGKVDGDVCCRLAWYNSDDLDFHMIEPNGFTIYYPRKRQTSACGGVLDVDANGGDGIMENPVENIVYVNKKRMLPGSYRLRVNQYQKRERVNDGFAVEIDVEGQIHEFSYVRPVSGFVDVAEIHVDANKNVTVKPLLPSSQSSRTVWNLPTQTFHSVQALMLSPNYWGDRGIGNKHYFFMIDGCRNDGTARGFYNEFLRGDLEVHRKTMEMVGSRMRTVESDRQLSGLGFSSTMRNSVLCRVEGAFTRVVKLTF